MSSTGTLRYISEKGFRAAGINCNVGESKSLLIDLQPLIKAEDLLPPIQSMHLDATSAILEAQALPASGPLATGTGPTTPFRTKLLAEAPPAPAPKPTLARAQVIKDRCGRESVQPPLPMTPSGIRVSSSSKWGIRQHHKRIHK